MSWEITAVLGLPLAGGLVLAAVGHRRVAAEINVLFAALTFLASAALTVRVIADGPILAFSRQFFVDPFNVFLVALTAFVSMTTAIFSRPYMRIEEERGKLNPARLRLYHCMFQLFTSGWSTMPHTRSAGMMPIAAHWQAELSGHSLQLYRQPPPAGE